MAQTTIRTDDIDQAPDAEECLFLHEGVPHTIDLAGTNLKEFKESSAYYASFGHKVTGGGPKRTRSRSAGSADSDAGKIRAWATANGYEVNLRGRISAEIREAYAAANPA